jgi:hypothetical protein
MKFLKVGGRMNIVDTIKHADMLSPFEEGCVKATYEPIYRVVDNLSK